MSSDLAHDLRRGLFAAPWLVQSALTGAYLQLSQWLASSQGAQLARR